MNRTRQTQDALVSVMKHNSDIQGLSRQEVAVLKLAAEGLTDNGIAHRLGISRSSVATYWDRIRHKLGPLSRVELTAMVLLADIRAAYKEMTAERDECLRQLSEANRKLQDMHKKLEDGREPG